MARTKEVKLSYSAAETVLALADRAVELVALGDLQGGFCGDEPFAHPAYKKREQAHREKVKGGLLEQGISLTDAARWIQGTDKRAHARHRALEAWVFATTDYE